MNVVEMHPGGGSVPAPGSPSSVRRWLAEAISAGAVAGCAGCAPHRPCVLHAADAVIGACRQEQLFIMPATDADAIIELAATRRVEELNRTPPNR